MSYSKSESLAAFVNFGICSETTFQKRMYFNIPSALLRSLLGRLVDKVQIPQNTFPDTEGCPHCGEKHRMREQASMGAQQVPYNF